MPSTFSTTNTPTATGNPALLLEMQVDEMLTHLMQLIDDPTRRQAALSAANSLANIHDVRRPYMRLAVAVLAGMDPDGTTMLWSDPNMMPGYAQGREAERDRRRQLGGMFVCAYCDFMWTPRIGTVIPSIMVCENCSDMPRRLANEWRHAQGMEPR